MLTAEKTELKRTLTFPLEVANLYGPYLSGKASFFTEASPYDRPGINRNQLEAAGFAQSRISEALGMSQGVNIVILGTMAAGKTTTLCLLAEALERNYLFPKVYKHAIDVERTGCLLINHSGDIEAMAGLYHHIAELPIDDTTLLVDEFQFARFENPDQISDFLIQRRMNGLITIVSQLDFNFRREPWKTTRPLLQAADHVLVLAARCADCSDHAWFPQRNIDGHPANYDDPEVMVGAEELYEAKCGLHHQVGGKGPSSLAEI